jgi:hypothetical protein
MLPVNVKLGAGIKFRAADFCAVLADIDINRQLTADETPDIGAGVELCFYDMLYLSAGYGFKHTGDTFSLGAGIKPIKQARISYAFQPFLELGFTHRISLDLFL